MSEFRSDVSNILSLYAGSMSHRLYELIGNKRRMHLMCFIALPQVKSIYLPEESATFFLHIRGFWRHALFYKRHIKLHYKPQGLLSGGIKLCPTVPTWAASP